LEIELSFFLKNSFSENEPIFLSQIFTDRRFSIIVLLTVYLITFAETPTATAYGGIFCDNATSGQNLTFYDSNTRKYDYKVTDPHIITHNHSPIIFIRYWKPVFIGNFFLQSLIHIHIVVVMVPRSENQISWYCTISAILTII